MSKFGTLLAVCFSVLSGSLTREAAAQQSGTVKNSTVVVSTAASAVDLHPVESQILEQTNAERGRFGLHPLALDASLLQGARNHASWMASNGSLQHSRQNVAENIAMGQSSAVEALRDWMNSPGHRANILNRGYSRVGIAAYTGSDGRIYWCQQFLW